MTESTSEGVESLDVAALKLIRGGPFGQLIPLNGDRMVLGRHPSSQIVLDDAAVSRHHAQILESHGTYYIEDLRSRNGTQVNQTSIHGRTQLYDGDQIKLCDYVYQFLESPNLSQTAAIQSPQIKPALRQRIRETVEGGFLPPQFEPSPPDTDDELPSSGPEASSIISSLEADSVQTVRLSVRPEVKLRAILDISKLLGRVLQVDSVLPLILDALFKIFPQAEWGLVLIKDQHTGRVNVRSSKSRWVQDTTLVPLSMTIIDQAMKRGQAFLSADAMRDERFVPSESLIELQIRSVMCTPLLDISGQPLGAIQISTRDLEQQFTSEDLDLLASVSSQCARCIENATLHETLLEQREIERELEFATQVQLGFLPSEAPTLPGYEFDDYYDPAHRVGGDYFDYIRLPNGHLAITVGDVAGKGVPAALLMARLHASARYHLLSATSAGEALSSLNSEIATSGLGFRFITLVMIVIDPEQNLVRVANAGHLPPLLRKTSGTVEPIGFNESGMPLGVIAQQHYQECVLPLQPGESLLLFTDGITEAMNSEQAIYGRQRLMDVFSKAPISVHEAIPHLVDDVERFHDDRFQRDDMCIVAVRRLP